MLSILLGISVILGLYACAWTYKRWTCGVCDCDEDLQGKTVIVTGGNAGIGLETARDLASRNARVIIACRSLSKGENAVRNIVQATGNTNVVVKLLDLSSFRSVRNFASDMIENESRVDVLINNAGVATSKLQKTAEGLEMVMTTNHFGPFLLTNMLLPVLKKCAPSRIVVVSSCVHEMAKLDFGNLNGQMFFKAFTAYSTSKLANMLFTIEMSEQLKGTGVTVNAVHPGIVLTNLTRTFRFSERFSVVEGFFKPLFKSTREGAQTSIHVAVAQELEGVSGKYFADCREKKLEKHVLNLNDAKRLWDYSMIVTGLECPLE